MTDKTKPAAKPDWERIEFAFRAGVMSLREIAEAYGNGLSHVAITRRAKKEGWDRDLSARIKARADALVTKRAVTPDVTARRSVTENEVVEANAANQAGIQILQRDDVRRGRGLVMRLMGEAEGMTGAKELLEDLGQFMRADDDKGQDKRNDLYQKIISFPGRVDGVRKLVESLRIMVELERKVNGIKDDAADTPTDGIRKLLKEIDGSTASLLPD